MGRKKKKELKPWCWYCNREFDEEKVLIYHQKAKHFKCHICGKKLYTGPGLQIHCMQVHRHDVKAIPNSLPNRSDPEVEVYGTEGIPFLDTVARAKQFNVELDLKDKNLVNAALPAKYERTLDAPYGMPTPRIVPTSSPSTLGTAHQSILKSYTTPPIGNGAINTTPEYFSRDESGMIRTGDQSLGSVNEQKVDRVVPPFDRCRIYHPVENISLEENRLKLPKYANFRAQPQTNPPPIYPTDENVTAYPAQYPPQYSVPPSANYPYPYPMAPMAYPPQPVTYVSPPVPMMNMYQQPMFPTSSQYAPTSGFFQHPM